MDNLPQTNSWMYPSFKKARATCKNKTNLLMFAILKNPHLSKKIKNSKRGYAVNIIK